jgi:hypothetical protein
VISEDLAFLAAHPTRRSNSEAIAHRREFKEAMRQRIKDIAASRDLSEEDIKAVMTLKHHEIGPFTEKHGVNIDWPADGRGSYFQGPAVKRRHRLRKRNRQRLAAHSRRLRR